MAKMVENTNMHYVSYTKVTRKSTRLAKKNTETTWTRNAIPDWLHQLTILKIHHYSDVIMGAMTSQITSLANVYSTVYSGADQRKHKAPHHWPLCGEFTGEFPTQMDSNAENVSVWWRHHNVTDKNIDEKVPIWSPYLYFKPIYSLYIKFPVIKKTANVEKQQSVLWLVQYHLHGQTLFHLQCQFRLQHQSLWRHRAHKYHRQLK